MIRLISVVFAVTVALTATTLRAENFRIEPVVSGLEAPWAVAFLPPTDGAQRFLVTERDGRLWFGDGGDLQEVSGVPEVAAVGQGGLLDVMLPRDFAESRLVYLSFAKEQGASAGTALGVGRLSDDNRALEDFRVIFEMSGGNSGGRHFGSRIVEAEDGRIFLTIGERGDRPSAQDMARHNGSVIRINSDGTVPSDNPFVDQPGVRPELWSIGHRNPQGAALDAEGLLWVNEHGAQGGDEVNRIERGANYGWPVISYGRHYSGGQIGEGTEKEGMEQPAYYWDPSIAPSGLAIYSGELWEDWQGDFFVGSLKFDHIARLERNGDQLREADRIETRETQRVRDVREAPDGSIWFLSVGLGALYRIVPEG
ncbi:PQQ-dependent sugar dehydrogenase [Aliiroseovarius sp. YM-037]|uniref:PQQ-dependent sugar dehydrogenase n=1 Tax=Aliiroseovarius sp. YM-037 TaxID=3341728 RepID=UPI003A8113CF